jgi:ABC-2 type transport system permease protein
MLLSTWLLLTVILPGAVNNYVTNKYPVPEALATMVRQREGYHEKWDMDKKLTMDKFYAHYPQFRKYPLPDGQFSWLWYYAMQQMGDDEAQREVKQMQYKLRQRENVSTVIAYCIPTLHTQHQLNSLAGSGLSNHLQFLDSTSQFHEKMKLYFYPKIFSAAPVASENWKAFRAAYFSEERPVAWMRLLAPLLLMTALFSLLSGINFRRQQGMH